MPIPKRLRLALGTTCLCVLVLLPFAAHFAALDFGSSPRQSYVVTDVSQLIRRQQYEAAYERLLSATRPDSLHQFRLAVCERALGMTDSAYARLLRLEGAIPLLDEYRRLWIARSLDELAASSADSQAAVGAYRDLIALQPHRAVLDSAYRYLGDALLSARNYSEALAVYRDHREAGGTTPRLLYNIAEVTGKTSGRSEARPIAQELMRRYPGHRLAFDVARSVKPATAEERLSRAQVFYRHKDDRRAIDELRGLLRTAPPRELAARAEYVLGRAYARSGQHARARHTFERLHEVHRWPSALYRLAGLQVSAGDDLASVQTYREFVRRYPKHDLADDALWQAAKAAERRDHFRTAGSVYAQLATEYPDSDFAEESAWGEGFSLYCQKKFEEALTVFRRVGRSAHQPHIVDQSHYWGGKAAQRLKLEDEAKVLFATAAGGFPRSYYASRAVAMGYGETRLSKSATLRAPLDADNLPLQQLNGADHVRRALVLGQLGLSRAAESELRLVEKANRGDSKALLVLRDSYDLIGLHNRALQLSTRASRGDRDIRSLYPSHYWDEIAAAAADAHVDPYLVLSVIRQESYFNSDAVSHAGAVGLMQIMPQTGRKLAQSMGVDSFERRLLFDPGVSIQFGSQFLADQVRSFADDGHALQFLLGLAAYNAGPRVARRWLDRFPIEDDDVFVERIPYKETRLYVKKVLKNYEIYRTLNVSRRDA